MARDGPSHRMPALTRQRKAELVNVLRELARADRGVLRQLTARFEVAASADALAAAPRQAIAVVNRA